MKLKIRITDKAKSNFKKLPQKTVSAISKNIFVLEKDCSPDGYRIRKIKAVKGFYRLRTGNYRIIFYVEEPYIVIVTVVNRKDWEKSFSIHKEQYIKCQLPNSVSPGNRQTISKPQSW